MSSRCRRALAATLAGVLVIVETSCATIVPRSSDHPEVRGFRGVADQTSRQHIEHVVMVDDDGDLVDPTGNASCEKPTEQSPGDGLCHGKFRAFRSYRKIKGTKRDPYYESMFEHMRTFHADPNHRSPKRLVIHIHGGMNSYGQALQRSEDLWKAIESDVVTSDDEHPAYPIFLVWRSSLMSSLSDHLVNIRHGSDKHRRPTGWLLTPGYFVADLARAAGTLPVTTYEMIASDLDSLPSPKRPKSESAACTTLCGLDPRGGGGTTEKLQWSVGPDIRGNWEKIGSAATWLATYLIPTKIITAGVIDAFGDGAWEVMYRRARTAFWPETDACWDCGRAWKSDPSHPPPPKWESSCLDPQNPGALNDFFDRLEKEIGPDTSDWQITLVGHSMGTILLNQILREHPKLPVHDIVFMAGACTIRDYENSVFPFLRQPNHQSTQVWHLMLHEKAEVRDRWDKYTLGIDLVPRGSLLVWVDNFFSHPESFEDRTLGRVVNFRNRLGSTPEDLRERVHVKVFGVGNRLKDTAPQKHGDFSDFKFWSPACWEPDIPGCEREVRGKRRGSRPANPLVSTDKEPRDARM